MNNEKKLSEKISLLIKEMNTTGDVQHLLDLGYELLGNPLLLVDISLCFLAHAGGNTVSDEPLWNWTLSKGYVTDDYASSVLSIKADPDSHERKLIWETGMLKHRQLVGLVCQNGNPLGYLKLLEYNREVSAEDEELLSVLCDFTAILISKDTAAYRYDDHPLIESFMTSLLTGKLYEPAAIKERADRFGLNLYKNLLIITIRPAENIGNMKERTLYLKKTIQNGLNKNTVVFFEGNIVVLYDFKNEKGLLPIEEPAIKKILAGTGCICGVSPVFTSLTEVSENYKLSLSACIIGKKTGAEGNIFKYYDFATSDLFLTYMQSNDPKNLIHPAINVLRDHFGSKSDDYIVTLFTYIDNFQNLTETSKELHLHHNTLKYRLEKIKEITDLDLNDAETIFRLALSKRIMALM